MPNRSAQESCRRDNAPPQPSPAGAMYYDGLVLELLAIHMEKSADYELKTGRKISHTPWSRAADAIQILKAELTRSAPAVTEEMVERAAKAMVRFSLGAFEDHGRYEYDKDGPGGRWVDRPPAFTPNIRAKDAARAALTAALDGK